MLGLCTICRSDTERGLVGTFTAQATWIYVVCALLKSSLRSHLSTLPASPADFWPVSGTIWYNVTSSQLFPIDKKESQELPSFRSCCPVLYSSRNSRTMFVGRLKNLLHFSSSNIDLLLFLVFSCFFFAQTGGSVVLLEFFEDQPRKGPPKFCGERCVKDLQASLADSDGELRMMQVFRACSSFLK